jgi:hypothetical protein
MSGASETARETEVARSDEERQMKTFTIEATFGDQIMRSAAPIDIVDRSIAEWTEKFAVMPADEARAAVRQYTLMNERHVSDPIEQQLTSAALVWLAAPSA